MKIGGVTTNNVGNIKNKKASSANSGAFAAALEESENESSSASAVAAPAMSNPLFMLQEVGERDAKQQEAIDFGFDTLEYLDEIKISLLSGTISKELLLNLDYMIKSWRNNLDNDPELASIIDEIELRAAVELAKLESLR